MIEAVQDGSVRGFLHLGASGGASALVLAHGAGSDCNSRLLCAVAEALAGAGMATLRIDLPFRQDRAKGPPHPSLAARDRESISAAVRFLHGKGYAEIAIGGHSYGGRQASMLASDRPEIAQALLLLSYPLHPPGRNEQKRTAHWPGVHAPALFVHGTRDPFGTPEELSAAVSEFGAPCEVLFVEGAGHELKPVLQQPAWLVQAWIPFADRAFRGTAGVGRPSHP